MSVCTYLCLSPCLSLSLSVCLCPWVHSCMLSARCAVITPSPVVAEYTDCARKKWNAISSTENCWGCFRLNVVLAAVVRMLGLWTTDRNKTPCIACLECVFLSIGLLSWVDKSWRIRTNTITLTELFCAVLYTAVVRNQLISYSPLHCLSVNYLLIGITFLKFTFVLAVLLGLLW